MADEADEGQVRARVLAAWTPEELADVLTGLTHVVGMAAKDWAETAPTAPAVDEVVRAGVEDPARCGAMVELAVRVACEAVLACAAGLRVLRMVDPEAVVWPPEVGAAPPYIHDGPERPQ